MVYNWLKNTLPWLFSKQCLLCLSPIKINSQQKSFSWFRFKPITGNTNSQLYHALKWQKKNKYLLCAECENDLPLNQHHCIVCSVPFSIDNNTANLLICGQCQINLPIYNTSMVPFLYSTPLKQMITDLKFNNKLYYSSLLAQIFIHSIKPRSDQIPDCIIPVPLHPQRLRERGFNQALELSRIISSQLNIPLDYSLCQRKSNTLYQSGLNSKQRKSNLRNAFQVKTPHQYKHVVIFDDVVTTGTTVNELARKLKQSGVEKIEVWAIARTESAMTRNSTPA